MSKSTENVMNVANILTVFRMLLIFPVVLFIVRPTPCHLLYAFLMFVLASYTDHLDGKLARKYGYITDFGKIMDPVADKLMVISVLICFCYLGFCSVIPVILIAVREVLITVVRAFALKNSRKVIPANSWGKFKTLSQILAICLIFLFRIIGESQFFPWYISNILNVLGIVFLWLSVICSWISGIIYLRKV